MQTSFSKAKINQQDEFYTRYEDIESEISRYRKYLHDKTVYCNCDDPRSSNFYLYFKNNFARLELKHLYATSYSGKSASKPLFSIPNEDGRKAYFAEYDGIAENISELRGNGDYRSNECQRIIDKSDIVVTNPPFSLLADYIPFILRQDKDMILIANKNCITYQSVFPYFYSGKLRKGFRSVNSDIPFEVCEGDRKSLIKIMACWITTFPVHSWQSLSTRKTFQEKDYKKLDNYDVFNVDSVSDIPMDYYEPIAVPITFLNYFNPDEWEFIPEYKYKSDVNYNGLNMGCIIDAKQNGKLKFARLLVRRKQS